MKTNKVNPIITQRFLQEIKEQRPILKVIDGIKIKTCRGVFPPQSSFSRSSKKLHNILGNLKSKIILDIGTGTGIQAIHAAKAGAKMIEKKDLGYIWKMYRVQL